MQFALQSSAFMLAMSTLLVPSLAAPASNDTKIPAYGGFYETCKKYSIQTINGDGVYLNCQCSTGKGQYIQNHFKLGQCFGNSNGQLVPQPNGAFGVTCDNSYMFNSFLGAACLKNDGTRADASIDMDSYINNSFGYLQC